MERRIDVTRESRLRASADVVWEAVVTFDGINDELRPLLRMTGPPGARLDDPAVPIGRRWFRSRLLLFGVLPIDYDDLTFVAIEPGRGFRERSRMLTMRSWEHDRTLDPLPGGGTHLRDVVGGAPRALVPAAVARLVAGAVFTQRHRRLRRRFG